MKKVTFLLMFYIQYKNNFWSIIKDNNLEKINFVDQQLSSKKIKNHLMFSI